MTSRKTLYRKARRQKGSALMISLVVMVGLTMLGLGFVALSETESAISVNERNGIQTQASAEAGARLVMSWFENPSWTFAAGGAPANDGTYPIKTTRVITGYSGQYKSDTGKMLFAKPYKPDFDDRFYGEDSGWPAATNVAGGVYNTADVIIDSTVVTGSAHQAQAVIDQINTNLFGGTAANPRIISIRVYAPPMSGGTLNTNGFWSGGTRYGTATIAATAAMYNPRNVEIARRTVRIVVGEFPTPAPAGPLQTATGSIAYGNSASSIHWGQLLAPGNVTDGKDPTVMPWANPYEWMHFERGYDDVIWPVRPGTVYDESNYLAEAVGRTYDDPWYGQRAIGTTGSSANYDFFNTEVAGSPKSRYANFQFQDADNYPTKKLVRFPTIRYSFWKRVALQGRGTKGVYYFSWDSATSTFKLNSTGTGNQVAYWVNTRGGAALNSGGGYYFFDSETNADPNGATTVNPLTPDLSWNSSDFGGNFLMKGFIYFNAHDFNTTGSGSSAPNLPYNMPGEPFRDIGFRKVDEATGNWLVDVNGSYIHEGAANGIFSYQDLNHNGRFDVVTRGPVTVTYNDSGSAAGLTSTRPNQYVVKTWHASTDADPDGWGACRVPPVDWNGSQTPSAAQNYCSEPHEPYLNFKYPTSRTNSSVTTGWEANNAQTQLAKAKDGVAYTGCPGSGSPTTTTPAAIPTQCTSNAYDLNGASVIIPAILDGLIYTAGTYSTQGNADMYGALLCGGGISGTGNLDFWFKEELSRKDYVPPGIPNVILFSVSTDELTK